MLTLTLDPDRLRTTYLTTTKIILCLNCPILKKNTNFAGYMGKILVTRVNTKLMQAGLNVVGKYFTLTADATCFSHVESGETRTSGSLVYLRILSPDNPESDFIRYVNARRFKNNARATTNNFHNIRVVS